MDDYSTAPLVMADVTWSNASILTEHLHQNNVLCSYEQQQPCSRGNQKRPCVARLGRHPPRTLVRRHNPPLAVPLPERVTGTTYMAHSMVAVGVPPPDCGGFAEICRLVCR
jgi:hypothetical protein